MYSTVDYDDTYEAPYHKGYSELSASTEATDATHLDGVSFELLEQAEVVNINDNNSKLFNLVRLNDSSVVATNEDLYEVKLPDS